MLVDVVKPYCLQWQDIHFALPLSALRQLNTSTFPCLERLTLSSNGAEPSDQTTDPIIIRDAPLLREATISFIPSLQVNLPMEQLTILDFTYMHIPQIVAVLRWCPNLVDLTCDPTCTARGDLHDSPPPVDFHALRSLNIPNENLLVYLTAPRLERLQIGRMFDIQDTTSALHALVSRSSCALKFLSFHFGGVSGTAAQIQQLFRAANTIEHLQFSLTSFKAPLLEALRSADVLPRLRRLEVHDWTTVAGDRARLLLDILVWRRAHGALESFQLVVITSSHCDVPPATIMAEFRALGEAGLEVQITTRKWDDPTPSVVLLDTQQQVT
jgi:hypothetical protein